MGADAEALCGGSYAERSPERGNIRNGYRERACDTRSLVARGLGGVRLVTSDAHPGLVDAIAATLPGTAWQRSRTHFMCDLLARLPKSAQSFVATMVRSIFAQPDAVTGIPSTS
jgi:transposase-like protein